MSYLDILKDKLIAHRGFHNKENPENSLGAFQRAVDQNYYIELDIQLSKDGEVMVFHDDTLKRMTGKEGAIHDYTKEELQTFKLADSNFVIPSFKEVLDLVKGRTLIVVELKNYKPTNKDLVTKMIEMLRAYDGPFVTKSFSPFIMQDIRKRAPEFIRGELVCAFEGDLGISRLSKFILAHMLTNFLAKPQFISTDYHFFTRKIRNLKKKGTPVLFWTVQDKQTYLDVKDICDNVIFERFDPKEVGG